MPKGLSARYYYKKATKKRFKKKLVRSIKIFLEKDKKS